MNTTGLAQCRAHGAGSAYTGSYFNWHFQVTKFLGTSVCRELQSFGGGGIKKHLGVREGRGWRRGAVTKQVRSPRAFAPELFMEIGFG